MLGYKILVVDDEISNLKLHIDYLIQESNNYEIMQANSGALALKIVKKKKPDLILLDWEMPDISGIDVINSLRENSETKDIAIIIITGMRTSTENIKEALECGAIDFLHKPVDEIELQSRVKSTLRFIQIHREKLAGELKIIKLLKDKIDFKDRELACNTLFLTKQNTEMLNTIKRLEFSTRKCNSPALKEVINSSIVQLKSNIGDTIWSDFKIRFEKIHPDFIGNLRKRVPGLSPTEQKLSILLRLNLSSKEIADILIIQSESVKTARSRLRKKFNLDKNTNMISYLSQF